MMFRSHMATGWIGGAGVMTAVDYHNYHLRFVVGGVCAVLVLWPDNDHLNSKWTKSLPPITTGMSHLIRGLSHLVYKLTATEKDRKSSGKHRYLTHTNLWAILTGGVLGWLAAYCGLSLHLAAGIAGVGWLSCVIHCLGDDATEHGCPFWFPFKIKGQRWYMTHLLPERMRLTTGTGEEERLLYWGFLPISVLLVPGVAPVAWAVTSDLAVAAWGLAEPYLQKLWSRV